MKIRNGFVSNSSSSSFIMRAVEVKKEDLVKILNIRIEEGDDEYDIFDCIGSKLLDDYNLEIQETGNYFGNYDMDNILVGKKFDSLEDGQVQELVLPTKESDEELVQKLKSLGIEGELKTFIQMVSNDNY